MTAIAEIALLTVTFAAAPSTPAVSGVTSCFHLLRVARGTDGNPVVLSTNELDQMATHRVFPKRPAGASQARIDGIVSIKVLIDTHGMVRCIAVVSGHPILASVLPEAVKHWQFRPYAVNGKPAAVLGTLDFHFSTADPRFVFLEYDHHPH